VKELLEFLVRSLVEKKDEVRVAEVPGGAGPTFKISVAKGEVGKIIGRQGRTVKAIRAVAAALDRKLGQRTAVEIDE
jgi:predicted RNA-binding protein YlqC (UPF0109 family)